MEYSHETNSASKDKHFQSELSSKKYQARGKLKTRTKICAGENKNKCDKTTANVKNHTRMHTRGDDERKSEKHEDAATSSVASQPLQQAQKRTKTPAERQREHRLRQKLKKLNENNLKLNSGSTEVIPRQKAGPPETEPTMTDVAMNDNSYNLELVAVKQETTAECEHTTDSEPTYMTDVAMNNSSYNIELVAVKEEITVECEQYTNSEPTYMTDNAINDNSLNLEVVGIKEEITADTNSESTSMKDVVINDSSCKIVVVAVKEEITVECEQYTNSEPTYMTDVAMSNSSNNIEFVAVKKETAAESEYSIDSEPTYMTDLAMNKNSDNIEFVAVKEENTAECEQYTDSETAYMTDVAMNAYFNNVEQPTMEYNRETKSASKDKCLQSELSKKKLQSRGKLETHTKICAGENKYDKTIVGNVKKHARMHAKGDDVRKSEEHVYAVASETKEKKRIRNREYQRAWRQRKRDLKKTISKEEKEEKRRKRHRENQRAYYYRLKSLKEYDGNLEELSQKKLDDLQMKKKKLNNDEDEMKKIIEDERKRKEKNKEYSKRYRDKKRISNLRTGPSSNDK